MPTHSQSILSKLGKICQELTVENVHAVNHEDRINVNVELLTMMIIIEQVHASQPYMKIS